MQEMEMYWTCLRAEIMTLECVTALEGVMKLCYDSTQVQQCGAASSAGAAWRRGPLCVMFGNERRTCLCGDNMPLECGTDEVYEMVFETGCALQNIL